MAKYCQDANDKISTYIGWDLKERSSIIVYNSHNDFQQLMLLIAIYKRMAV